MEGPDVIFDLTDAFRLNPSTAHSYMDMYYMSDEELSNLYIDMDGLNPLIQGSIHQGTVHVYVSQKIRHDVLDGYDITHLRALHEGYIQTPPENPPSATLLCARFSRLPEYTPNQILAAFQVSEDSALSTRHTMR